MTPPTKSLAEIAGELHTGTVVRVRADGVTIDAADGRDLVAVAELATVGREAGDRFYLVPRPPPLAPLWPPRPSALDRVVRRASVRHFGDAMAYAYAALAPAPTPAEEATARFLAALRAALRAWSAAPTLLELDDRPEAPAPVPDDGAIRAALLEIDEGGE